MEKSSNIIWVRIYIYKKKVKIDSILFCKLVNHKIEIYLSPGGKLEGVNHSLQEMETMLPPKMFFRCNRQCIINLDQVDSYSETIPEVILLNGEKIPIAKDRKDELLRRLEE
jgi:two-component system, LytTR family, response regulator